MYIYCTYVTVQVNISFIHEYTSLFIDEPVFINEPNFQLFKYH